jgi:hypothetical protein
MNNNQSSNRRSLPRAQLHPCPVVPLSAVNTADEVQHSTCVSVTFLKIFSYSTIPLRLELLGHGKWQDSSPVQATETHALFRLVVLGCVLANKWLDDHTFSNKTWCALFYSTVPSTDTNLFNAHTISGVPIQSLNKLKSLAPLIRTAPSVGHRRLLTHFLFCCYQTLYIVYIYLHVHKLVCYTTHFCVAK